MEEVQILKPFAHRTEYKVMREWMPIREVYLTELNEGTCVIPAVVLSKLSLPECAILVNWAKQWGNQLLIFPPFHSVDLKARLRLVADLTVNRVAENLYEGLPVNEIFLTNLQPKLYLASGKTIALDISYHSGSGLVTISTLPLLDYRLLAYEEKCQEIFQQLLFVHDNREDHTDKHQEFELTPLHVHLIILAAAGITSMHIICAHLKIYFNTSTDEEMIKLVQEQLRNENYLALDGNISFKGQQFIEQSGYRAFVKELAKSPREGKW